MDALEQSRFDALYAQYLRALKLQGKAAAAVDGYARAVRRVAAYFDRCPDQLSAEDYKTCFASRIDDRPWSLVKIERCGLQFFHRHVLGREWPWVDMVRVPQVRSLPGTRLSPPTHCRFPLARSAPRAACWPAARTRLRVPARQGKAATDAGTTDPVCAHRCA